MDPLHFEIKPRVIHFLDRFEGALRSQLEEDEARWGDEWLERTRKGQEERIFKRIMTYRDEWTLFEKPVPWLKIAGLVLIAWIRENNPEIFPK